MPSSLSWRVARVPFTHPDAALLIAEVQREYVARYGGPDDTPLQPSYFEPPGGSFFVGYLNDDPVATGAWWMRPEVDLSGLTPCAEVKRMYVVPRAQRQGLAQRMLNHLQDTARAAGAAAMILETGSQQPEAIALYQKCGYARMPGFGFYKDSPESRSFGKPL